MTDRPFYILIVIAIAICVARFFIEPTHVSASGTYQAVAHLFVGGLFGGWMCGGGRRLAIAGLLMSALEVFAAIITRL